MEISKRLKELRKSKSITVARMAEIMEVSQPTITRWENGTIDIPSSVLVRICTALGLTLAEFFAEETSDLPHDLRQLLKEAEGLTVEQRQKLTEFIRTVKG